MIGPAEARVAARSGDTAAVSEQRVVVVGAGLGGLNVVEELRRGGHTGPLALVGAEAEHPYDRPPLSKEALRDGAGPAHLRAPADFPELDLDLRLGRSAVGLDLQERCVALDDGTALPFDALVLAPGAAPRTLPELPDAHVLRTHADAVALRAALLAAGHLLVVGGGFVGCEVAASARALGAEVDLVEVLPGPLVRVLGPQVAGRVAALHTERGVRLHGGVRVTALDGDEAVLSDGTRLPARAVLVGLGVRPATDWLSGLALAPDGGIVCGAAGRTSVEGVWAVGDAAQWEGRRTEHWTSAMEQASTVVQDVLTGTPPPHLPVPYVWSEQHGSLLQCLGEVAPGTEAEVHEVGEGLVALHADDAGRLLGVVTLDAKKQVSRGRKALREGADLETARALLLR